MRFLLLLQLYVSIKEVLTEGSSQNEKCARDQKLGNCYLQPCFFGELVLPHDLFFHFEIFHSFIPHFIHGISSMAFHQHATMKNWANLIFFSLWCLKKSFLIQSHQVLFPSKKWFLMDFKNTKQEDTGEMKLCNDPSVTYIQLAALMTSSKVADATHSSFENMK